MTGTLIARFAWAALAVLLTACASAESPPAAWPAGACTALEFSPDAGRLAAGEQSGRIRLLDPVTSRTVASLPPGSGPVQLLRWSPDGRRLVFRSREAGLAVVEPGTTPLRPRILAGTASGDFRIGAFNTSGTLFAAGGRSTPLRVWRLPDWTPVPTGWADKGIQSLAFSPSGDELAVCMDQDVEVRVLSTADWSRKASYTVMGVVFYRADGALLLLRDERHVWHVRTLRSAGSAGRPSDPFRGLPGERVPGIGQIYGALAVSRDGSAYVVSINNYVRAHRFGAPGEPAPVALPATVTAVAVSADGTQWAAGCIDGTIRTGTVPLSVPGPGRP